MSIARIARIAAATVVAGAGLVATAPAASANCTTDYVRPHLYAQEEIDYVEVSGLVVTVHGDRVEADVRREVVLLIAYVDCVV